jgi:hypothetical protein
MFPILQFARAAVLQGGPPANSTEKNKECAMPTNVFGRVEMLLEIVKIALPIFVGVFLVIFALVSVFAVKYRRVLKNKIFRLPGRNPSSRDVRRRRTYYVQQHPQQ